MWELRKVGKCSWLTHEGFCLHSVSTWGKFTLRKTDLKVFINYNKFRRALYCNKQYYCEDLNISWVSMLIIQMLFMFETFQILPLVISKRRCVITIRKICDPQWKGGLGLEHCYAKNNHSAEMISFMGGHNKKERRKQPDTLDFSHFLI